MSEGRQLVLGEVILSEAAGAGEAENAQREAERNEDARIRDGVVGELVRDHARLVYRIGYAVLRSHHEAEDATQETFLRVLRYSHKLDVVEDPKPWLARIAWRVAVDRAKRHSKRREVALEGESFEEVATHEPLGYKTAHSSQVGAVLEKLIAALPAKLRAPLLLATLEEMSPREVATTLGINEAAVRSRVHRARQILREKMAARFTGA
jgi:RNA polymerase sigma-70 factor (ECF subfamily)